MRDLFNLDNKVAVITGGMGQLGQQYAVSLAEFGAKVAIIDKIDSSKKELDEFKKYKSTNIIKIFKADITKRNEVENVLKEILSAWNIPDILINNAAIDSPPDAPASENGPFESYPEESLNKIIDVNIKGTFICCQVINVFEIICLTKTINIVQESSQEW